MNASGEITLLGAAWRRKWLVLAVALVALVLAFLYARFQPQEELFLAEATVLLQDPSATLEGGGTSERFVVSQVELMESPVVAGAAVEVLASGDPPILEDPLDLLDQYRVSSSNDSSLVFISIVEDDEQVALAKVNAVAEGYRQVSRAQATTSTASAVERIDAQIESIENRLVEIDQDLTEAVAADEGLAELQNQAQEAVARIAELQEDLPGASDEQAAAIRQEIQDERNRLEVYRQVTSISAIGPQYTALVAEQDQLLTRRSDLVQRRDEVAIDGELTPDAVALASPAQVAVPVPQTGPERILAVGLVLGVLAGLGLAYLLEMRRRVFEDRLQPEAILGAPLLADIPEFAQEQLSTRLPVRDAPRSAAAEAFRFAAASLESALRGQGHTSVMVVASTLGHGKTTVLANTGMATARQGQTAILVDCDFGNQDATALVLGDQELPALGFTDTVEAEVPLINAITPVALGNGVSVDLLSRGTRPTIAANLVRAPGGREVFQQMKATHDLVLVDAPPVLQVAYASTVASYVDALVIVVRHGSPVRELEDLVNRLKLIGTPVVGYIYNRSPLRAEMTATEGSMMDILGTGRIRPDEEEEVLSRSARRRRGGRSLPVDS